MANFPTAPADGDKHTVGNITYTYTASTDTWSPPGISLGGTSVDSLADIDTTTTAPATGDTLTWDGTKWVPQSGGGAPLRMDLLSASSPSGSSDSGTQTGPTGATSYAVWGTGGVNTGGNRGTGNIAGITLPAAGTLGNDPRNIGTVGTGSSFTWNVSSNGSGTAYFDVYVLWF